MTTPDTSNTVKDGGKGNVETWHIERADDEWDAWHIVNQDGMRISGYVRGEELAQRIADLPELERHASNP